MKPVYRTFYVAFLGLALLLPACNRADDDGVSAAPETRDAAEDQMERQRDAYVETVQAKLDEFDQKLDGLDERASTMQGATKENFEHMTAQLRDRRNAIEEKLDDLDDVRVDSWMSMKGQIDSEVASLERSYEQLSGTHAQPTR